MDYNKFDETNIKFSSDYVFNFYNLTSEQTKKINLRAESVFKLSIKQIINKFREYFPDTLEFEIKFEKYLKDYVEFDLMRSQDTSLLRKIFDNLIKLFKN